MAATASGPLAPLVRRVLDDPRVSSCPDQELLRRFLDGRDESAFEALLRRHGPMVLDVCRGVLRNDADVEDAFQATFLVLARRAGSIRKHASLASWLHGVAYRVSRRAQAGSARRDRHEGRVPQDRAAAGADDDLTWRELRRVVHEELGGLADRYRAPLVLCYLEGKTQDEAARQLGLPKGTLKDRLERGRALLRARLVRRGFGAAALLVAAWPAASHGAGVSDPLVSSTLEAAAHGAARGAATAAVPARVAALTEGVLRAMFLTKLKTAAAALVAVAVLAAGLLSLPGSGPGGNEARGSEPPAGGRPEPEGRGKAARARELTDMERKLVGTWQGGGFVGGTVTFGKDGTFTHAAPGEPNETGTWALDGRRLTRTIKESQTKDRVGAVLTREVVEVTDSKLRLEAPERRGAGRSPTLASTRSRGGRARGPKTRAARSRRGIWPSFRGRGRPKYARPTTRTPSA